MRTAFRLIVPFLCFLSLDVLAQADRVKLDAVKIEMYSGFMAARHGGKDGLARFKSEHRNDYTLEMWYYTESFYIKRNHLSEGAVMDPAMIDVTRFEQYRKAGEDAVVELPGFKDALVLLANNKLIYKPNF